MHSVISCPKCQARLRGPADTTPRRFRCVACGFEFAMPNDERNALDALPVEETRIQQAKTLTLVAPLEDEKPKPVAGTGCFLDILALTPLGIAALGVPFCRFGAGWIAGVA